MPSQTTDTTEVLAHPDGQFELISNALPVRVRVDGHWSPISTTLRRDADGSWSAKLTTAPVTFSGGGTGPLVTATDRATGRSVSVSWPYPLPAPVVSGSVATYENVLPGVNLRLQATSTGYQEILVVRDAAAAADPRLRSVTFTLTGGRGVTVTRDQDGATVATDTATGKVLFTSGQPMLWDSSRVRQGPAPGPNFAGSGLVSTIPVHAARVGSRSMALTLSPPTEGLDGRKFVYPLYEDPEISDSGTQYYAEVANFGGYWNSTTGTTSVGGGELEEGYCGYSDCIYDWDGKQYNGYVDRDYFQMNISALEERNGYYPDVYSATFYADEIGNSDGCTAQDVALYSSGAISSSTRWGGPQGSSVSETSSAAGGNSGCSEPAADVDLSATSYLQAHEDDDDSNLTFEIRAPSETNELQYKVFTTSPKLDVYYNFAPLTPTGLAVSDPVTCTSTTYTSQSEPTLSATGKDNNPSPLDLDFTFTLDNSAGTKVASDTLDGYASGSTAKWDSEGKLSSGTAYEFDAYTTNVLTSGDKSSARSSPTSGMFHFTDLSTPPAAAPTISSFDYPSEQWGQPAGAPGVFTVGTNGDADIAGFAYSFDGGSGSEPVPDTTDCTYLQDGGLGNSVLSTGGGEKDGELALVRGTTAQIQIPPSLAPGRHTLYVRSFDYAHNASPEAAYTFYVTPDFQSASQPVSYVAASSLAGDATGANASLVSTQANASGLSWSGGDQLLFSATAAGDTFAIPLTVKDSGTYQLGADMTTSTNYGEVEVDLDESGSLVANLGGTADTPFDGYSSQASLDYLDFGTANLTAGGSYTLVFTVTGEDASSTGLHVGINYLTLSPTNRYETDSLSSALTSTGSGATLGPQCFGESAWSDNCQLFLQNTQQGTSFSITFDAPVESDYALGANLTTADDYGELQFLLDPSTSHIYLDDSESVPVDAYSPSVSAHYVFLGAVHLTAGLHVLQVSVVGTDSSSVNNRYNAGLNYLEAAPVTGATDSSFTTAMNNLGIVTDGGSDAGYNLDLTGASTGDNLSLNSLQAADINPGTATAPGNTFSLNGATFTMPQLSTNSAGAVVADNVIPDGQTIPLPAVNATGVGLLVLSTCGSSPAATATLNYSGAQSSNAGIPSIPDWIEGSPSDAVMVLSYRDESNTPQPADSPKIFEVMLPANPNGTLSSITLPVMSTDFVPGDGCPTALHILAIGTRTVAAGPSGTVWTGAYEAPMDATATGNLSNETLREVVPLSSDGSAPANDSPYVRIHLSNAHSNVPVTFDEVTVAAQASAGGPATAAPPEELTFGGSDSVTLPAGGDAWSDPVSLPSMSGTSGALTVSMHIPSTDDVAIGAIHETSNLTTYYATGNDTTDQAGTDDFSGTDSLTGQYYLSGVDVTQDTPGDGTIAVLGDQTATQAPAWTYGNWTSDLPAALSAAGVAVPGSIVDASTSDGQPSDWWQMNGTPLDTATTAYDSGSVGTDSLTLEGGAGWSTSNPGTGTTQGSLSLNGTSAYAQASGPAITSTGSFAVSAWVNLSSLPTHNAVVAAQDGTTDSGFDLGYNEVAGGVWSFYFANSDTTSPSFTGVYGPAAAAGVWTLLTGVYNADSGQIQLYVNGTLAGSTSFTPAWSAGGAFTVGRDLYNGVQTDFFPGLISDVRAYNDTVMWGYNVGEIDDDLGTSSITSANAPMAFEDYAAVEPNLRDVIISLGANDVLKGQSATTIESNLQNLISDIEGRIVNDEANGTPVQAFITTIPPLGLSSSDPREAVREAVNSWLLDDNTSADAVFDIAGAVADPSSPNDIDPGYLTDGVPNSAYYQAIASAVASDIADAIPPVNL